MRGPATGRIFLDYLRNDRMATAVAPLSPGWELHKHDRQPLAKPDNLAKERVEQTVGFH